MCYVCVYVYVSDPRCNSTGPTSATRRSPMPTALAPLRVLGSSAFSVAYSAKRILSRRSASAHSAQRVPLEHRLIH